MVWTSEKAITLQLPPREIADRGTVRLGSGSISATFPSLRLPPPEIADRGTVRLGSGSLFGSLQALIS
jgi:hypothetical protein